MIRTAVWAMEVPEGIRGSRFLLELVGVVRWNAFGFGRHLRDTDLVRVEPERERFVKEKVERERNWEVSREEHEASAKLELEKYKLLIPAFASK